MQSNVIDLKSDFRGGCGGGQNCAKSELCKNVINDIKSKFKKSKLPKVIIARHEVKIARCEVKIVSHIFEI